MTTAIWAEIRGAGTSRASRGGGTTGVAVGAGVGTTVGACAAGSGAGSAGAESAARGGGAAACAEEATSGNRIDSTGRPAGMQPADSVSAPATASAQATRVAPARDGGCRTVALKADCAPCV